MNNDQFQVELDAMMKEIDHLDGTRDEKAIIVDVFTRCIVRGVPVGRIVELLRSAKAEVRGATDD